MSEDKKEKGKKKSAIEQGALMNEIIKRDNKFYSLNDNFHLDVKTPTKPNNVDPAHWDLEERAKIIPQELRDKIKHEFQPPIMKYKWPMTSSMEIGWNCGIGLNTTGRKGKNGCDVTKYADEYCKLGGRSPYATKEIKKTDDSKK